MEHHFFKRIKRTIKHWYLPLLAGVILVVAGIMTFMYPLDSYVTLALLFSLSFVISGLMESVFSIANRKTMENWGWHLASGILSLIIGVLLLMNPAVSIVTLPYYVGFLILFRSAMAIGVALDLKNYRVMSWGNLMVAGVLGILFSFMLLWNPMLAGLTVVTFTGLALITAGILNMVVSFKLKKIHDAPKKISKELMDQFDAVEDEIIKSFESPKVS